MVVVIAIVFLLLDESERGDSRSGQTEQDDSGSPGLSAPESDRPAPESQLQDVKVLRIVDGDTIEVLIAGEVEDIRYIGIDTPESVKPDSPVECFGEEASDLNADLVEGTRVRLVFDRELRDRFGRLLAYVYRGSTFVNAELVERGFATTLEIPPNTSMADELGRLESAASAAGRGLWGSC